MQTVRNSQPVQERRVLRYYGHHNQILIVVGYQVVSANAVGVTIIENGFEAQRKLIPWRRVHDLVADPNDPILNV